MSLIVRPPIITVMGHIDHGKSKLLDYIRRANVVEGEAGGITQHLGAYEVEHESKEHGKRRITFLDTPGHEAFQAIRARGSAVADIAVLMIAADEGVKPQTLQAFETIKTNNLPYIVALNKIDKPGADPIRIKTELSQHSIFIEEYGGDVPCVEISAINGTGVDNLLDMILLVAELEELKADSDALTEGYIIESDLDQKAGIAATIIISNGTLKGGMFVRAKDAISPVRIMLDTTTGKPLKEATFSTPVRLVGWSKLPEAGEIFTVHKSKKEAEKAANEEKEKIEAPEIFKQEAGSVVVPLILRSDVSGSLEAIKHELSKINKVKLDVKIVDEGVGTITENDVKLLAGKEHSVIVGFNVGIERAAVEPAERGGVTLNTFTIIYELAAWIEEYLEKARPIQKVEEVTGTAKILKNFSTNKNKQVIGGRVTSGVLSKNNLIIISRNDIEIGRGTILGLQSQKSEVNSIDIENEFGSMMESETPIMPGDIITCYHVVER